MSITDDVNEFKNAVRDIATRVIYFESETDRVRCCQWVRKLSSIPTTDFENAKLRNDYIQLLRIQVKCGGLHGIFTEAPPEGNLKPLNEALGSYILKFCPHLPPVGPIAPIISHRTLDGRAYLSIKHIPGHGVLCYMAASPDGV